MLAADPVTDPVLRRTINAIVERRTRHLSSSEQREVRKDLTQELRLQVLELAQHYRGDNGASFATFIYRALSLHAYHVLQHYQRPVHAGKNNKDGWRMLRVLPQHAQEIGFAKGSKARSMAVDPIDTLEAAGPSSEELVENASVGAHLRKLAREVARKNHEAVEAIVLRDETLESAAARTGRPVGELRRAVRRYHARIAEDRELKALYASGR